MKVMQLDLYWKMYNFYLFYQHMSLKNNRKRCALEIGTVEVSKQLILNN